MDVLVCVKRVPMPGATLNLTDDERGIDTRYLGFTVSPHEECAVEEAVRITAAGGGRSVVLTLGPDEAVEQLRDAISIGMKEAVLLETGGEEWGPQSTAAAIAAAIEAERDAGRGFDLMLFGNEAADTGDYQVPIRVAHALGVPVATGIKSLTVDGDSVLATREYAGAVETYRLPLPCVVSVREGINLPRYPSLPGRIKAKKAQIDHREPSSRRGRAAAAPAAGSRGGTTDHRGARHRSRRGTAGRRGAADAWSGGPMSVLCLVEHEGPSVPGLSLQAVTFARSVAEQGDGRLVALVVGEPDPEVTPRLAAHGVTDLCVVADDRLGGFAARAWAQAVRQVADELAPAAVVAPGSDRGHDVLAHLAALTDLPMAAGCLRATVGEGGLELTRIRWAGSLLEEAVLSAPRALLAVAPQLVPATTVDAAADVAVRHHSPTLEADDLAGQVVSTVPREAGSISLSDARVVVGGGRGVGGAEQFAVLEELAALLGGTVGGSRVVTSLGWRPHRDQVGQTGTRIAPELYLACGISGAIQHMAGCKSAKHLLAVNTDPDAPIMRSADYAVIGDLHEVLPAIVEALRALPG